MIIEKKKLGMKNVVTLTHYAGALCIRVERFSTGREFIKAIGPKHH